MVQITSNNSYALLDDEEDSHASNINKTQTRSTNETSRKESQAGRDANRQKSVEPARSAKPARPQKQGQAGGRAKKHDSDRVSGTGKVDTPKKEKQGWGDRIKSQSAEAENDQDRSFDEQNEGEATPPEAQQMTLSEYKASQAASSTQLQTRAPNDGEDILCNAKTINSGKSQEEKKAVNGVEAKPKKEGGKQNKKQLLEIEFVTKPRLQENRGPRTSRNSGRGGSKPRFNQRSSGPRSSDGRQSSARESNATIVNTQDEKSFPKL